MASTVLSVAIPNAIPAYLVPVPVPTTANWNCTLLKEVICLSSRKVPGVTAVFVGGYVPVNVQLLSSASSVKVFVGLIKSL